MLCIGIRYYRIPEVLFEGSDVWAAIEEEEDIEELQKILSVFIFSVVVQRVHHAIMEVSGRFF